jgi:hypothetical protein
MVSLRGLHGRAFLQDKYRQLVRLASRERTVPAPYLLGLTGAAKICVEEEDGDIGGAFKVSAYPAFVLLDADGAVAVSGHDPAALPEPATV